MVDKTQHLTRQKMAPAILLGDAEKGDMFVSVEDTALAAALVSVGIQLRNPPYYHIKEKGGERWVFIFNGLSADGTLSTTDCVAAWKKDLDFIKENPEHPFAFAMAAVRNYRSFLEHQHGHVPYVMFSRSGGRVEEPVMMVVEGSKKHKAAIARGLIQL